MMKKVLVLAIGMLLVASCSKKEVITEKSESSYIGYGISGSDAGQAGDLKTINFDFDKSTLTAEAKIILKANAEWLKKNPKISIQIEGHCDSRGTIEYNLALGEKRSITVKKYIMALGVKKERLSVISYGKERPIVKEENEAAWAKNRRANFVITSK
ncbi:MAG: peptidoglycan-associated lipoprotein Pal [Proteobacteria bacterium]|nr:peptidoglycan-associated lipoprotein Pal [Pseudomonadota bacterium]